MKAAGSSKTMVNIKSHVGKIILISSTTATACCGGNQVKLHFDIRKLLAVLNFKLTV
jgi:hypothetical protein